MVATMSARRRAEREGARQRIDRKIRLRVVVYLLIFLAMDVIVVVDGILIGSRSLVPVLTCAVGGVIVGVIASRMYSLSWDAVSTKVIGRLDTIGAVILVGYVLLAIFRSRLLDLWLDAPVLGVAGLAAVAGLMAGQVLGTRRGVRRVLRVVADRDAAEPAAG